MLRATTMRVSANEKGTLLLEFCHHHVYNCSLGTQNKHSPGSVSSVLFIIERVVSGLCFSLRIFGHPEGSGSKISGEIPEDDMSAVKVRPA